MVTSKHSYRADIDGLRALAVLSVVLFHAGVPFFSGGFVGVDVFFVISGFLITSLILKEIDSNTFSLVTFWERRVRRIVPALVVVIAFVAIVGWFLFLPDDFTDLTQSIFAQGVFSSNVLFWAESGYFDGPSELKPLLHTWSLSVEEQFYIVFPLLLSALGAAGSRFRLVVLTGLALGSLVLSTWGALAEPNSAFYLLPFRAWELLLGAALSMWHVRPRLSPAVLEFLSLLGVALIAVAVVLYGPETRFPGAAALLPCVGAALIIWTNSSRLTVVGRFLATRPLVTIGLISYSLYLWHWPLLAFARYALPLRALSTMETLAILIVAGMLSWLSWKFVELPIRRRTAFGVRKTLFAAAAGVWVVIVSFGVGGYVTHGYPLRVPSEVLAYGEGLTNSKSEQCLLHEGADLASATPCVAGPSSPNAKPAVLLFGDSHLAALAPVIEKLAAQAGLRTIYLSYSGCPALLEVYRVDQPASHQCKEFTEKMLSLVRTEHIEHVVLASKWSSYVLGRTYDLFARTGEPYLADSTLRPHDVSGAKEVFRRAAIRTIQTFNDTGVEVWIVRQVPSHKVSVADSLAKLRLRGEHERIIRPLGEYRRRQEFVNSVFAALESPTVHILDPSPYLCIKRECVAELSNKPLYKDNNHLTPFGSMRLMPMFEPMMERIAAEAGQRSPVRDVRPAGTTKVRDQAVLQDRARTAAG